MKDNEAFGKADSGRKDKDLAGSLRFHLPSDGEQS